MDSKTKEYLILAGAGLGILIVAMLMLKGSNVSGTVAQPSSAELNAFTSLAEQSNSLAQAQGQAALAALTNYEQTRAQLELGLKQIQADVSINSTNAESAQQIATIQEQAQQVIAQYQEEQGVAVANAEAQAAQSVAQYQYKAAQAQAQAQQNAANTASTNNLIGNILGTIAGFIP